MNDWRVFIEIPKQKQITSILIFLSAFVFTLPMLNKVYTIIITHCFRISRRYHYLIKRNIYVLIVSKQHSQIIQVPFLILNRVGCPLFYLLIEVSRFLTCFHPTSYDESIIAINLSQRLQILLIIIITKILDKLQDFVLSAHIIHFLLSLCYRKMIVQESKAYTCDISRFIKRNGQLSCLRVCTIIRLSSNRRLNTSCLITTR